MNNPNQKLTELRTEIDKIDEQLCKLILERFAIVEQVATIKRQENLPIAHPDREQAILQKHTKNINPHFKKIIEIFFISLFKISKDFQESIGENNE